MENLFQATSQDADYISMVEALRKDMNQLNISHPLRALAGVKDQLSSIEDEEGKVLLVVDNKKIVVPEGERSKLLSLLHKPHQGFQKTLKEARSLYFWPGMSGMIKQMCQACETCLKGSITSAAAAVTTWQ